MKALAPGLWRQFGVICDGLRWISLFPLNWPLLLTRQFPKREEYRAQLDLCSGFDVRWLRWALTVLSLFSGMEYVIFAAPFAGRVPDALLWSCASLSATCGVLCVVFYLLVIMARLQCSLAEWIAIIAVLANLEGLVLSTPGIRSVPWMLLSLPPLLAAGILHAAAESLAEAAVLGLERPLPRALLMLGNLAALPGIGVLILAALIFFANTASIPPLNHWSLTTALWLLLLGLALLAPGFISGRKARRKAQAYLTCMVEKGVATPPTV